MTPTTTGLNGLNGTNLPTDTKGKTSISMPLKMPNNKSNPRVSGDPLTLPPGISSEQFHHFIARAQVMCGEENVTIISDPEQLSHEHYTDPSKVHDMHNIVDKEYFVASAVVCPKEVPDVQGIMRLANELEIPVWPFSIGRK
jgi:hypothetical protein